MKFFKILYLLFLTTELAYCQQEVSFSIQAHQDDWQLFMASNITNDISSNAKVVFITFTAGDGGLGTGGSGSVPYYKARENGSVYSSKYAQDIFFANPQPLPIQSSIAQISYLNSSNASISHNITKYVYKNSVNYFLRLPDGNYDGTGYSSTGNKSLQKLKLNQITSISALDGSATYDGWNDLALTIKQIILNESGSDNQVWINTPSISTSSASPNYNPNDHSDHKYSSIAARDAVSNLSWVGITGWVNYDSSNRSQNLSNYQHEDATALFAMYNWGLIESGYNTNYESSHQVWLPMDYYAIDRLPSGSKNNTSSRSYASSTDVPLILSYSNPINAGDELFIDINAFETGKLKVEAFNLNGQLLKQQEFAVKNLGINNITLNSLNIKNEMSIIKVTLNNKHFETRKLLINK